jgi:thiol-disulfide isomerase/thioredoxin
LVAGILTVLAGCERTSSTDDRPVRSAAASASAEAAAVHVDDGSELVGTAAKPWHFVDWAHGPPLDLAQLRGRVAVVRFWTNGCHFCEATLPALQRLAKAFPAEEVVFIAAFHAKPKGSRYDAAEMVKVAEGYGVTFPIAFDPEWRTLDAWYLNGFHRPATSTTFVIGRDGRIAHVHPGPMFFPSDDPKDQKENADYLAMKRAITDAIAAPRR